MKTIHRTVDIKATKEKIWATLLGKDTYPIWTAVFSPGSTVITEHNWEEGSDVRFVDSSNSGIAGTITKHILAETITFKYYGFVAEGKVITEGKDVEEWKGAEETYTVTEGSGVSRLDISVDMADSMYDMMAAAWDKAIPIIKELSEKK